MRFCALPIPFARALFASVMLSLVSMTCPASAQQGVRWTPFVFTSAAGDSIQADSGRVVVPENRARPNGPMIQIAVVRIPTTSATPGAPLVYLAGGPGGAGIAGARGDLFPTVLAFRAIADVILYDQRGTGTTLPSLVVRAPFGIPLMESAASATAKAALLATSRAAAADIRSRGIDLASYNTIESADDLEDIRRALGARQLIVWGHSYGSHLGLAYLRRHPASVQRAILGGINGPDHRRRFASDADLVFARLDSIARRTPTLNAVMPDFIGTTRRVLDRLAQAPASVLVDSQTVLVSREDVQAVIAIQSGEQAFVRRLPWIIGRMDAGDYTFMARLVRDVIKNRPMGTAMTWAMDLASGVSPERARLIAADARTALLGNAINYPFDDPDFRAVWAPADLGPAFRAPVRSQIPTLFISGTLDGRTSLRDAEDVRRGFRTNAHLIVDGASHNPYALHPDVRKIMVDFASGGKPRDSVIHLTNVELRGPDESELIADLKRAASASPEAAGQRMRELGADPKRHVTSFVAAGAIQALAASNREAAAAILIAALDRFPENSSLLARLGDLHAMRGDTTAARAAYQRAVSADPFNQAAALKLARMVAKP